MILGRIKQSETSFEVRVGSAGVAWGSIMLGQLGQHTYCRRCLSAYSRVPTHVGQVLGRDLKRILAGVLRPGISLSCLCELAASLDGNRELDEATPAAFSEFIKQETKDTKASAKPGPRAQKALNARSRRRAVAAERAAGYGRPAEGGPRRGKARRGV